jgi:hypothetical protein
LHDQLFIGHFSSRFGASRAENFTPAESAAPLPKRAKALDFQPDFQPVFQPGLHGGTAALAVFPDCVCEDEEYISAAPR